MLFAKRPKCDSLKSSLHFPGHMTSPGGVAPDPSKLSAIRGMAAPTGVSHLSSFLGCTNFYEWFIPQYATICAPLTDLLGSHVEWCWGPPQQCAFDTLKAALCSTPVLLIADMQGDSVIETDASNMAIGGVLYQDQGNGLTCNIIQQKVDWCSLQLCYS